MKQLLVLLFFLCSTCAFAQDVIVKKDGSTILSRVLEVNQNEVKYKKFNNLDGPTYSISKSELQSINYKNGAKDTFSAPVREENRYLPNNQNDGEQRINDRALIALDYANSKPLRKAKTLKTVGWIGGAILAGCSVIPFIGAEGDTGLTLLGCGLIAGGGLWVGTFQLIAHNMEKKYRNLETSSIYQINIRFKDNSTITSSVDILRDQTLNTHTIGLGLRYNF